MPSLILFWIWLCAGLNAAGWGLSAIRQLNATSYVVLLGAGVAGMVLWGRPSLAAALRPLAWFRLRRRFGRPFPLGFLILTLLVVVGGALYPPCNYDGMTYREPRILHWLAAGQWHWIHTLYPRVNARACGVEWVSAPIMALTHSDRLLFLINVVSFLLLPGLVFSVFTRLGVRARVAWHWMWIVPSGYCFLLQAGSSGNDLFGAPFVLAALDFALRAKTSRRAGDLFTACLAVGLMTSAKTSDLPLLLPWGLAILPSWRLALRWPVQLLGVALLTVACSFLPTAILNARYCGDWTGWKEEGKCVQADPPLRLVANLGLITAQNLVPPVFPQANAWNVAATNHIPPALLKRMHETVVEPGAAEFHVEEMQIEENAGLGVGVCLLLGLGVIAALWRSGRAALTLPPWDWDHLWQLGMRSLPLVSLLALLSQSEVMPLSRILAPYYAVLLPPLLVLPGQGWVVGWRIWRWTAGLAFLLAVLAVVVSPPRPLFPVHTLLDGLPPSKTVTRARAVYGVYEHRSTAFDPVLAVLPPDLKVLGVFVYDDPEVSLWRPFGQRRILHVLAADTNADLQARGIEYVLINTVEWQLFFHQDPATWVRDRHATVIRTIPLLLRVSQGKTDWWLVKLP